MRRYKLYKKNELVKAILKAKGYDKKYNPKLSWSAEITLIGAIVIKLLKEDFDNPYINSIELGSVIIYWGEFILFKYEQKIISKNKEKLNRLKEELAKQGIKVDFVDDGNEVAEYTCDGIDYINVAIDETNDIVCYQDGTVEYVDSDENRKDITDEVYKIILPEKKYKKHVKRKNKDGE